MNKISIIIPIHELSENNIKLLNNSIESIIKQNGVDELPQLIIVYPKHIENELIFTLSDFTNKINIIHVINDGNIDYQSQVNLGVKSVTTDYFSVLEFDDEYGLTFLKNNHKYIESYPEIDVFLNMIIEVNEKNEGIKLTNETVWSQQFVGENGEMGYLNSNSLKQYTDFKLSGAVIKTTEFLNIGGYKSNIKLTFMYEFLLRALNNTCKIFSIPKIGYKHFSNRDGSLFDGYFKNMSMEEKKFWFDTAVKECNFLNDRLIDVSKIQKQSIS